MYNYSTGSVKRKSAFKHEQNAQIQLILRIRNVSSGPCFPFIHFVVFVSERPN